MIADAPHEREIIELHDFFEAWLGGTLSDTSENFARFVNVMGASFNIIGPDGSMTAHESLTERLRSAHGARPGLKIWIENIHLCQQHGDLILATYEEWQEHGGETKARLSSVLFRAKPGAPNGLEWLHVHETWLP